MGSADTSSRFDCSSPAFGGSYCKPGGGDQRSSRRGERDVRHCHETLRVACKYIQATHVLWLSALPIEVVP
jgi:hypothetical protein